MLEFSYLVIKTTGFFLKKLKNWFLKFSQSFKKVSDFVAPELYNGSWGLLKKVAIYYLQSEHINMFYHYALIFLLLS
jgi:hypothetical protein